MGTHSKLSAGFPPSFPALLLNHTASECSCLYLHDNVLQVDFYQLAFLAIEGAFISCAAAFYLAYLLRAVAAQRYKLYGTFLVIPVVRGCVLCAYPLYVTVRARCMVYPPADFSLSLYLTNPTQRRASRAPWPLRTPPFWSM